MSPFYPHALALEFALQRKAVIDGEHCSAWE